jgi:hypothetical protein
MHQKLRNPSLKSVEDMFSTGASVSVISKKITNSTVELVVVNDKFFPIEGIREYRAFTFTRNGIKMLREFVRTEYHRNRIVQEKYRDGSTRWSFLLLKQVKL